jgi:hypothetical protein
VFEYGEVYYQRLVRKQIGINESPAGVDRRRYAYEHLAAGEALELASASAPNQKVITPCPITIALFTSVMSLSNIIGLLRRWTMDFVSRLLSKMSKPAGFSGGAQNSSARA